ncbi:MAG: diguanylate cyclase [Desulfovibrionaceae bacterium]
MLKWFDRIGFKVLFSFVAAILPLISIIIYLNNHIHQDAIGQACNLLSRAVFEAAAEQDGVVSELRDMLRRLAGLPAAQALDSPALEPVLRELKSQKPSLSNIFLYNSQGDLVASAVSGYGGFNADNRKYFQDALRRKGFAFGQYIVSKVTQTPVMHFSMPVYDKTQHPVGVLVAALNLDSYGRLFDKLGVPEGGFLDLFDGEGQRLLRYPGTTGRNLDRTMDPALRARIASGRGTGPFVEAKPGEGATILAYRQLRAEPADPQPYGTLVIGLPVAVAMSTANQRLCISGVVSAASVAAAILVAVLLGRVVIVGRLRVLADLVTAVEQNRICPLPHDFGHDEIGLLGRRFTALSRELHEKNLKLAETMETLSQEKGRLEAAVVQLGRAQAKVAFQANHDALTGLGNRRSFNEHFHQECARSRRSGSPFTLVLFDIDDFKVVNDTYGHWAGDEALRFLAGRTRDCLRETDAAFRVGGEEFALILPDTSGEQGLVLAERLRKTLAASLVPLADGGQVRLTVSCGLAACPGDVATAGKDLYKAADRAMYQAKALGKNRCLLHAGPPSAA